MTSSVDRLGRVRRARIPKSRLDELAHLRHRSDLRVRLEIEFVWLAWETPDPAIVTTLLPIVGAALYEPRPGGWFEPAGVLPVRGMPDLDLADTRPLDRVILPAMPTPTLSQPPLAGRITIRLVRDEVPRVTSGVRAPLLEVLAWASTVPEARFDGLTAAVRRQPDRLAVLVRGTRLPDVRNGSRFWGERVLIPLGWRTDPPLSEPLLRTVSQAADEELLVWEAGGAEAIPDSAFSRLTLAGLRLAAEVGA